MSTHPPKRPYPLYPAAYFAESPTYDAWVKLTAADVHSLQSEKGFEGQRVYFYLNHPIRFVRIVGVVIAIDDINLKYTVLTIDDGSGANIELKIIRIPPAIQDPVDTSSNTAIDNVNIISRCGVFDVTVDNQALDIGSVVKAKCTISEFRGIKQLELKRVSLIATTNEEAQAWAEAAAFKQDILSRPWHVSPEKQKEIEDSIKLREKKAQEYQKQRMKYEAKKREQRRKKELYYAQREERLELRRRKEEIEMNAGALI
ncbi:hypothetical protein BDW02DRAFT_182736 [Decorospora gaudefroyi]|uniref:CST complex subunit Stn1 N-terminal domain-containing protein n=1 Tax=Decorospora gaudefroyi TaxID=184978 RepID=A0A6A5JYB1_9PLEO|nr:hypothetical protein BDW02DRAFT_182736 [Decorospora gaudefroyi]